jgi:hypothetical protein
MHMALFMINHEKIDPVKYKDVTEELARSMVFSRSIAMQMLARGNYERITKNEDE